MWIYGHNLVSQVWIKGFGYILDNLAEFLSPDVVAELGEDGLRQPLSLDLDRDRYRRYHEFDQSLYLDLKTRLVDFILLEEEHRPIDEKHRHPYSFQLYERRSS